MARIRLVLAALLVVGLMALAAAAPAKRPPPKRPPPKRASPKRPPPKAKSPPPPRNSPPPPAGAASSEFPKIVGSLNNPNFKGMAYTTISGNGQKIFGWRPDGVRTYAAQLTVDREGGSATFQSWTLNDATVFTGPIASNANGQVIIAAAAGGTYVINTGAAGWPTKVPELQRRTAEGRITYLDYPAAVGFASDRIWFAAWQLDSSIQVNIYDFAAGKSTLKYNVTVSNSEVRYIGGIFPCIAVSRDGGLIAVSSADSTVFTGSINLVDASNGKVFPIDCRGTSLNLGFNGDGTILIALVGRKANAFNTTIALMNKTSDGGKFRNILFNRNVGAQPPPFPPPQAPAGPPPPLAPAPPDCDPELPPNVPGSCLIDNGDIDTGGNGGEPPAPDALFFPTLAISAAGDRIMYFNVMENKPENQRVIFDMSRPTPALTQTIPSGTTWYAAFPQYRYGGLWGQNQAYFIVDNTAKNANDPSLKIYQAAPAA